MTTTKPHKTSKKLAITNIGQSRTVLALMIRVSYTTNPTITMTAKKDFELSCKTVNTVNRVILADAPTFVSAGTVLHLVASDDLPGWYYIGRVDHGQPSCTCSAHQNRLPCKHKPLVMAAHQSRIERQNREIAAAFVDASAAIESEAEDLLDEDSKIEKWTEEELAHDMPTACLPYVNEEERAAFWQAEGRKEHAKKIARGKARWQNFDRLAATAQAV